MYELKLQKYQGPLEKLLELIEARQMDISDISLAEVTEDFLRHLEAIRAEKVGEGEKHEHLRLIADFIVVASRLVFIKSKSLLPDLALTETEEEDIKDLETRLRLYRELRPAMKNIARLWRDGETMHGRGYLMNAASWLAPPGTEAPKMFFPGRNVTAAALAENLGPLFRVFENLIRESEVIQGTIVTLDERIAEITKELAFLTQTSFADLTAKRSRPEQIVTFLALLHLAREQRIEIEQAEHLSDIIVRKSTLNHGS